jgi:hypothetical protein
MACGGVWRAGMGSTNASGTPARWLARCWYAPPTPCTRAGCAAAIASTSACVTGPSRKGCRTTRRTRCRCRHRDRRSASRIVPCASRRTSTAPCHRRSWWPPQLETRQTSGVFLSPVRRADADSDHSQGRTLEHNTARNAKHATAGHDRARPLPCGYRDRPGGGGPVLRPPRAEDDERGRRRRLRWSLRARSVMHASHRGDFRRRPDRPLPGYGRTASRESRRGSSMVRRVYGKATGRHTPTDPATPHRIHVVGQVWRADCSDKPRRTEQ